MSKITLCLIVSLIMMALTRGNYTVINVIYFISLITFFVARCIKSDEEARKAAEEARKAAEKLKKEKQELRKNILRTSRGEFIRGFKIVRELGWVTVADCNSSKEAEEEMQVEAARIGGNGIIKMHWRTRKEDYVAGHGKNGNPYYRSRTVYDGEGVAVSISKSNKSKDSTPKFIT